MRKAISFFLAVILLVVSSSALWVMLTALEPVPAKWIWAAGIFLFVSIWWLWEDFVKS
jgi:hypothetical protein